jgi:hypothetical protein
VTAYYFVIIKISINFKSSNGSVENKFTLTSNEKITKYYFLIHIHINMTNIRKYLLKKKKVYLEIKIYNTYII